MKTKYSLVFVLFITAAALLSGCGKSNTNLTAQNADLKARIQKLEQQLQASSNRPALPAPQASESATVQNLKSQLAAAKKKADAAADQLKSLTTQVESQRAKINELTHRLNELTRQLSAAQQSRENAEKALKLYQDNATSAIQRFQTLRSALGDKTVRDADYRQSYPATRTAVTKLAEALPESAVRRQIMAVLATFTHINNICETADQQMQARTRQAKANYDKLLDFGGLGPNRFVIKLGKARILAPAEQANAATASKRNQQVVALETDLDLGIKDLQLLVNSQST